MDLPRPFRVAMAAWEIGRTNSGLGAKAGGLGVIVEELPAELIKAAEKRGQKLEIEILSPCFAHYDKSKLKKLDLLLPVTIDKHTFNMEAYEYTFTDRIQFPSGPRDVKIKSIYFWDHWQLHWTNASSLYPHDPQLGLKLFASISQAMSAYIRQHEFHTVHLHDYHVGLVPFYLGDEYMRRVPVHFTVHNATYQGVIPLLGGGYASLYRINLPGDRLFHRYFDQFDNLCMMKACILKVHEFGGHITTVSGDWNATWGYAAELKQSNAQVWAKAWAQKGSQPGEVFHPNRGLNLFESLPILGITNGMSESNRPENLNELKASFLRSQTEKRGGRPLFNNPVVQAEMLERDHNFDVNKLEVKQQLRRLLYLEAFGHEPYGYPILFTAVGRLVDQKNLGAIADVVPRVLSYDNQAKFIILASAQEGDTRGIAVEHAFQRLAWENQGRVYFNNGFNAALSKLILAGGDFTLIPSRFEPCGLVDYEAALLGTVPIARSTGGLPKIRDFGYLYEWLDISDRWGEANAFFWKIKEAIDVFRTRYQQHQELMRKAMQVNASWDKSADEYLDLYRYGMLVRNWKAERMNFTQRYAEALGADRRLMQQLFIPASGPYFDSQDWELRNAL